MKSRLSVFTTVFVFFLTPCLPAQTVSGRLVEQASDRPVVGAFVLLVGADTAEFDRALTDAFGRFSIQAPSAGSYALKSAVIGFRSTVTPRFDLSADQDIVVDFVIPGIPVALPTLFVEDVRTCGGPIEAGLQAAIVWEEARKALDAVIWTEQQGTLRHVLVKYERVLDPQSLEITDRRQRVIRDVYRGSPFLTGDPHSLAERGYIQATEGSALHYKAPDANVLLSDDFAALHCFSLVVGDGDRSGHLGLAFEPDATRELPDIEGVLWLDAHTAELRYLDYSYTRIPYQLEMDNVGGRVEFEHLPAGPWIVRRWWIRMPVIGVRRRRLSEFATENYLAALKEDGGYVREVSTLDGETIARRGVASLSGMVFNLRTGEAVPAAHIVLVGTQYSAQTNNQGQFRFGYLPEATYRVSYGNATLDVLGYVPPLVEVSLRIEEPQFVTLAIPPISRLWSNLCPGRTSDGVGIVSGFVRDSTSFLPVAGAQVLISEAGEMVRETTTDWAGHFRSCNIPGNKEYTVEARWAGAAAVSTDTETVQLTAGDIIRIDFALPTVENRPTD